MEYSNRESLSLIEKIKPHQEMINALLSGVIIAVAWKMNTDGMQTAAAISFIAAFIIGGFYKAKEGISETIESRKLNVEILMILAAIGSAIIGYWLEGAILIFIFAVSGALETYAMNKSHKEISALMELQPEEAWLVQGDAEPIRVPVAELKINDQVFVKPGERLPVDGVIYKGHSTVDEAAITGESMPVTKEAGDAVFAGTVNLNGAVTVTVTKRSDETMFQKIIHLVQSAQSEKSPSQQFIEKFENVYVKVVLISVAIMLFLPHYVVGWDWTTTFYRAMVLLVVASPCALVASVMPATLSAISNGARHGILFKGGAHLEQIAGLQMLAVDKTGTLTEGTPNVTDFIVSAGENEEEILAVLTAIESQSTHPLAQAIVRYSDERKIERLKDVSVTDIPGHGIEANFKGIQYKVGKPAFVGSEEAETFANGAKNKLASEGKTVVFIRNEQQILALVAMKDTVRQEAKDAIAALQKIGINVTMLTGDNEQTAKAIAKESGVNGYVAECLPETKVEHIKKYNAQYEKVGMVGDGINDAPALATASVGIAMGDGTDVALETADVVLMKNDLSKIEYAVRLSRKMQRIVKQNIFFSVMVIITLIFSNFVQAISLPLGVIGHEGSTILVILNSLRLLTTLKK